MTLTEATEAKTLIGNEWTLALGNQSIASTHIEGAFVTGLSSGDGAHFVDCEFPGASTIAAAEFDHCGFDGTMTFVANKNYSLVNCHDDNASTATQPIFSFAASNNVGIRRWTGGIEIANFVATDYITLDGAGRLVIASTCDANPGGTITIRGAWAASTDNVAGGFNGTLVETQRYASLLLFGSVDVVANTHTPTTTVFQSDSFTEATADHYVGRVVLFTNGSLSGQAAVIDAYELVTTVGQFTVREMTEAPADNDTFVVL